MKFRVSVNTLKGVVILLAMFATFAVRPAESLNEQGSCRGEEDCQGQYQEEHEKGKWKSPEVSKEMIKALLESIDSSIQPFELELIILFLKSPDGFLSMKLMVEKRPEKIAEAVLSAFNFIDEDNDALITKKELEAYLERNEESNNNIKMPTEPFNILDFIRILNKLGGTVELALKVFDRLERQEPLQAKKLIDGTCKRFVHLDEDNSGALSEIEFKNGIIYPDINGEEITEERKSYFFKVMDVDQSGDINFFEFSNALPPKLNLEVENFKKIFEKADTDQNRLLSLDEFSRHIKTQAASLNLTVSSDEEIKQAFDRLDRDEDSMLSPEEMGETVQQIKDRAELNVEMTFTRFDADQDSKLSKEEIAAMVEQLNERSGQSLDPSIVFSAVDINKNGEVSLDELKELIKKMTLFM